MNNNESVARAFLLLVMSVAVIFLSPLISLGEEAEYEETNVINVRAKVTKVLEDRNDAIEYSGGSYENSVQVVEVKITTKGPYKNRTVKAEYSLSLSMSGDKNNEVLKAGDEVLLAMELDDNGGIIQAYIYNVARDKYLFILVILFAGIILSVGRLKGLKALISLVLTVLSIFYILLPLILKGFDPVFISVWVCTGITAVTLFLVSGINKKTLAAVMGTSGGVIAAGFLAQLIGQMAKLTGLGSEESQMLLYIPQNISYDFKGLMFAGILIGALGAAMDVGMSLTSAMFEIKELNPSITKGALIQAGMNIGRDMIATMSNTLILAYVGGSMQLLLLLMAYEIPLIELLNQDGIASEVVRSLAGSIGLILTIPLTALTVGLLSVKRDKNEPHY